MTTKLGLDLPQDYEPSPGELDNMVYLIFKYGAGIPMRQCDLAACTMMASTPDPIRGPDGLSRVVDTTCEYLWDHFMGEPDHVSPGDLSKHMAPILEEWYSKSTSEERAKTA